MHLIQTDAKRRENSDSVVRSPGWRSDPRWLRFSGYLKQLTSPVRPDCSASQAQIHISISQGAVPTYGWACPIPISQNLCWEGCGVHVCVCVSQSCLCDPMDNSLPGSTVHEILQARILEWVAIPFSRGSSWPRGQTQFSWIACRLFTIWATREGQGISTLKNSPDDSHVRSTGPNISIIPSRHPGA